MPLKDIKQLWYDAENLIMTYRNLNVIAKEPGATQQEIIAASEARDKWLSKHRRYKTACIEYVTELIHESA